jgi:hypothetical protein
MGINKSSLNASTLATELIWLKNVIQCRFDMYWNLESKYSSIYDIEPPNIENDLSPYALIIKKYSFVFEERLLLILSLAVHIQPQILDIFFTKNSDYNKEFTEFGGYKGKTHVGFIPTGETAIFILAGSSLEQRFNVLKILSPDHVFNKNQILMLENNESNEPFLSGVLSLSTEYLNLFTHGNHNKPDYNSNFPAKLIQTNLDWSDLIVSDDVLIELQELKDWMTHGDELMNLWGLKKNIKQGYRVLFYGPPGTGKTLTACLLGKFSNKDVYRIDLSLVVSKYIGETEKNLGKIFDQAVNKDWILFFDEADALFGKRTQTSSSNDRYANQEVSYLLQKIEDFPGIIILATNLKANLDEAFARRFQNMIYFNMPNSSQRNLLWRNAFSNFTNFGPDVKFDEIADKFEISGGAITNVVRFCSLRAFKRNNKTINHDDIISGIRKEMQKEGKVAR